MRQVINVKVFFILALLAQIPLYASSFKSTGGWYTIVPGPTNNVELTTPERTGLIGWNNDFYDIPETVYDGNHRQYTVVGIGKDAFKDKNSIVVSLPNTVRYIAESAFEGCSVSFQSFSDNLTSIKSRAFYNATISGHALDFSKYEEINDEAFYNVSSGVLDPGFEVKLGECLKILGFRAFSGSSVRSVSFPDKDLEIGYFAFNNCNQLKTIDFGNCKSSIESGLFGRCTGLESIILPSSVCSIGEYSFYECSSLQNIEFNLGLKTIQKDAFRGCSSLTSLEIPNSVEYIGESAFSDCSSLTSLEIPNSVAFIGEGVFRNCSSVEYVKLPDQCTEIPNEMFAMCTSLKDFVIPDGIQYIGKSAFSRCYKAFNNICFPSSLYKIGDNAFEKSLTHEQGDPNIEIFLPPSLKKLGNEAFSGCSRISKVTIAGEDVTIGSKAFLDCKCLQTAIIGNPSLFPEQPSIIIGEKAFVGCNSLSDLQLSYCVKSIDRCAFLLTDNSALKEVYIPSSITYIGKNAFYDRGGLHDIYYPSNTPCNASEDAFGTVMFDNNEMYLHIPSGSRVDYWMTYPSGPWAHFRNYREEDYSVEAIKIISSQNVVLSGDSLHLETIIYPSGATNRNIIWSSDNDDVAIVGADGTVIGVSTGVANITASSGEVTATCQVTVNPVKASSIILSSNDITLQIGNSDRLTATVEPDDTFDKNIKWFSDNTWVATVDSEGTIRGLNIGIANITASCGDVSATCKVTITPKVASGISLSVECLSLPVGGCDQLIATVEPEDVADKTVVWSSDNETVAKVWSDGVVWGISEGIAKITATCGEVSAACNVTVNVVRPYEITLNVEDLTLSIGDSYLLTATVEPENTTDKTVVWASDDEAVAIVESDGTVTGVSAGAATITATCGEASATCKVTVNPILIESISLSPESWMGEEGDSFKIDAEVFPENATDKTLLWSSDNESVAMVDSEGKVSVLCEGSCIITAMANDGSSISAECFVSSIAGIEAIFSESDSFDVYNSNGILIKKNCNAEYLKTLAPDVYIIRQGNQIRKMILR